MYLNAKQIALRAAISSFQAVQLSAAAVGSSKAAQQPAESSDKLQHPGAHLTATKPPHKAGWHEE
jgi:hypothetical protein